MPIPIMLAGCNYGPDFAAAVMGMLFGLPAGAFAGVVFTVLLARGAARSSLVRVCAAVLVLVTAPIAGMLGGGLAYSFMESALADVAVGKFDGAVAVAVFGGAAAGTAVSCAIFAVCRAVSRRWNARRDVAAPAFPVEPVHS